MNLRARVAASPVESQLDSRNAFVTWWYASACGPACRNPKKTQKKAQPKWCLTDQATVSIVPSNGQVVFLATKATRRIGGPFGILAALPQKRRTRYGQS